MIPSFETLISNVKNSFKKVVKVGIIETNLRTIQIRTNYLIGNNYRYYIIEKIL